MLIIALFDLKTILMKKAKLFSGYRLDKFFGIYLYNLLTYVFTPLFLQTCPVGRVAWAWVVELKTKTTP